MTVEDFEWVKFAAELEGPGFAKFQIALAHFKGRSLDARLPGGDWRKELAETATVAHAESEFIESLRSRIAPLVADIQNDVDGFIAWFEDLRETGPGQGDPLFPWLAAHATREQMRWFLYQEVAGEAGFEDLLAMTQVKISEQAKLEMARNYWDEMGRGASKGMHGPMLARLATYFAVAPTPDTVVPESLALGNTMVALARHRRYAYHSIGALGVIEMTAPTRAGYVNEGLRRLRVPAKERHYFAVHAVLDVKHSEAWNREVLRPLVAENPRCARAIGGGAVMRLWHGARCFERYRREFKLAESGKARAVATSRASHGDIAGVPA
jgi:Iron-containing redox enzyme